MHFEKKTLVKAAAMAVGGVSLLLSQTAVFAHGESLRGGGAGSINAVGASILENFTIGLRMDGRRYETFSRQEMVAFRQQDEDVHAHSEENAYFLSLGMPISEDLDLGVMIQYNQFKGFRDNGDGQATACFAMPGNAANPDCVSETDDSRGWGDTLITARYRFYNDGENQWAGVFGLIVPTGKITNKTDKNLGTGQDEILGTHNQPGSGAYTVQGGIAFSGHLSEKIAVDADALYRVNGPGANNFRAGNSFQFDVAAAYGHHSRVFPVLELNGIFFKKDNEENEPKTNSGGDVIYISPGININLTDNQGIYGNVSYPIYQELGGISNDEKYRFSLGWSYSWGARGHEHM